MTKLQTGTVRAIGLLLALAAFSAFAVPAGAEDYPARSIRLIIPFSPGGSNDVVGRIIANQLGEKLGKQVFVDNRSGAGGVVGSDLAAKAAPDGYTLLIISIAHASSACSFVMAGILGSLVRLSAAPGRIEDAPCRRRIFGQF